MKKKIKTPSKYWIILALVGVLLAVPNGTVLKIALDDSNPFVVNAYRYALVLLVTLPLLIKELPRLNRKNFKASLQGGFAMAIALLSYVWALELSPVSYVSILLLLSPLAFIVLSSRIIGEKISSRGIAGITLAAIGAMLVVVLPVALSQSGEFVFYPWATLLMLVNCVAFPLATIRYRQANEAGLSLGPIMAITAVIALVVHAVIGLVVYGPSTFTALSGESMWAIVYSGIAVGLLARVIGVIVYERIGSVASGALAYLETLLSIMLPLLWLHEKLSIEMVLGGTLILLGVYVAEHRKSTGHKHFHMFRHH